MGAGALGRGIGQIVMGPGAFTGAFTGTFYWARGIYRDLGRFFYIFENLYPFPPGISKIMSTKHCNLGVIQLYLRICSLFDPSVPLFLDEKGNKNQKKAGKRPKGRKKAGKPRFSCLFKGTDFQKLAKNAQMVRK